MRLVTAREDALTHARMADLLAERDALRAANAELLATLLALKASGATTVKPLEKKVDRVSDLIADVAGSNHTLRRQLGAFARSARADGKDEQDILHKLMHWDEDESGVPE